MNEKVKIGDVLKKYREEKGVSLAIVEAETGVSRSYINRLERSSRSNPTLESVSRLVKYFGIPFSTIEEICGCSIEEEDSIQNLDYLLLNEKYLFANIIADINLKIALRNFVTELENYCTVANITRKEESKLLDKADILRSNLLGM
ncbi:helix-turn-helix domain-containing protein [Clostridium saccharobutylicum]|uniref:HTH-type transcriptional regulator SinR n=1 Tax=Clostridium saccharobutylicum TaxID=169679 RepID=A0A1S8MND6_CLOSA|nr:helix-turn-helix transcriptional regulator [Clostridium saccharobutylicum]OOM05678.1 HTH-type transcriptional regulator SinR [Clostridium saccharobutylicum]